MKGSATLSPDSERYRVAQELYELSKSIKAKEMGTLVFSLDELTAWHLQALAEAREQIEKEAIKTVEHAQQKMRPMILLDRLTGDDNNYAMYWDDETQTWSRARYKGLIAEAKRQIHANQ